MTSDEADVVVDILARAFYVDPLWSWVFSDPTTRSDCLRVVWQHCFEGAVRYPWTFVNDDSTAASMWIPPDGTEFTPEQEAALVAAMDELLGTEAGRVNETFEEFEKAHPRHIPHFYLSLLGTHPDHVGHGYGLTLLAENLAAIDDAGYPAYLEASHPGNVPIYERFGFEPLAKFQGPNGGPVITGMWRPGQGPITVAVNS